MLSILPKPLGDLKEFERILFFKCHEQCKYLIARAFMRLLNYYMAEEIAIAPALVSSTVQIKNLTINWPVMSQSQ